MDLATFPVDCQNLQICLKPYKLETEKLILRPRREESAIEQQDSHEWNVSVVLSESKLAIVCSYVTFPFIVINRSLVIL